MEYLPLIVGLGLVLILLRSGIHTANLTAGGLRLGILAVVIASVGILGLVAVQILMPRPADTEGTLSAAGDTVALSPEGPGLIHVEAVPESEDIQPGAATLVDLLIRGELGKERRSLRFVLFDEDTDLEAEAPPLSERRHLSFSTPGMGKSPELKLMEMKPADSVTLNLTWRSHWVSVPLLVIILAILALIGSAMEAAVPNGMARTFLSVTLGIGAFFAWNIQDGLPADGAVKAVLVALAWSFAEGAVLGSLIPGWLTRVVPEGPVGTGGE